MIQLLRGTVALAAAVVVLWPSVARGEASGGDAVLQAKTQGLEALDYAFRFASAISSDDNDRTKAQAAVVRDLAEIGAFDEASSRAAAIDGWRRAVALAELAQAMARAGRPDEARGLLAEARRLRAEITDWHGSRVDSHVAQALAALGQADESRQLAEHLVIADRVQYLGSATLTQVRAHLTEGGFEAAMSLVRTVDVEEDPELEWWRSEAYVEIGHAGRLTRAQRLQALSAAWELRDEVPEGRRSQSLESIAEAYHALGDRAKVEEALSAAAALIDRIPDHFPVKPSELASLARVWAGVGEPRRARDLLRAAESVVPNSQPIEQPTLYAWVASGYLVIDDTEEALRVWDRALAVAGSLANARPRALAFVAISRSIGREGMAVPDSVRPRLDAALEKLRAS